MSHIPVKDHSGLFRDSNTGAIISNNKNDFQKYIENRNRMLNQSEKVEKLEKNLDELNLSKTAMGFFSESKKVSNKKLLNNLNYKLIIQLFEVNNGK